MNPNCHLRILAFHENRTSICLSFPGRSVVDGETSPLRSKPCEESLNWFADGFPRHKWAWLLGSNDVDPLGKIAFYQARPFSPARCGGACQSLH